MYMNKYQKRTRLIVGLVILLSAVIWIVHGTEIFTKTEVLVETQDEVDKLMGTTHKEWKDTFIWGLDLTLLVSGIAAVIGGVFYFFFRKKEES